MIPNGRWTAVELVFSGHGLGPAFLEFVADRARRFSLDGWAEMTGAGAVAVTLCGPDALIDMLEVACLLGPVDCLVDDVTARAVPRAIVPDGFSIRAAT